MFAFNTTSVNLAVGVNGGVQNYNISLTSQNTVQNFNQSLLYSLVYHSNELLLSVGTTATSLEQIFNSSSIVTEEGSDPISISDVI